MRKLIYAIFPLSLIFGIIPSGLAHKSENLNTFQSPPVSQINVNNVAYVQTAPGKFTLSGNIQNPTSEPREIVVRGILSFYDQSVRKGDVPLFTLRKDTTIVLTSSESRLLEIPLMNEGEMPRGAVRIEPVIRVRRQRIWNY